MKISVFTSVISRGPLTTGVNQNLKPTPTRLTRNGPISKSIIHKVGWSWPSIVSRETEKSPPSINKTPWAKFSTLSIP